MKFYNALLLVLALAKSADAKSQKLRGLATSRAEDTWYVNGDNEDLGQCHGTVCGMWGDPHILTCDGLGYDCNARGLFTMMNNALYNIQGHFIHVNSKSFVRILDAKNFPSATYTNDIVIQNVQTEDVPVMQFSFPEPAHHDDGLADSEQGCLLNMIFDKELNGYGNVNLVNLSACRERCEGIEGCTQFYYTQCGNCHVAGADATYKKKGAKWSRTVAGPVDKCGHPAKFEARKGTEIEWAKVLKNGSGNKPGRAYKETPGCPVLYYENGELVDISGLGDGAYLHGDANSPFSAKLESPNRIKIVHTTKDDKKSELMLEVGGEGPGELWGCHWNLFVCLPKGENYSDSVGLLGSPDKNAQNDWMLVDDPSNHLTLPNDKKGQAAFDYCTSNWCVSQDDSIMTPPVGLTYDDIKCTDEEYEEFDINNCVIAADKIIEYCGKKDPLFVGPCQVDCCAGGCDADEDETVKDIKELSDKPDDILFDEVTPPENAPLCEGDDFDLTGETACPTQDGSIVKILHQSADIAGVDPIIYGITFADAQDDDHGREVSFRVRNPFGSNADIYVRYEKKVGLHANDPKCDGLPEYVPGCNAEAPEIIVGCVDYPGVEPFAVVNVYFASAELTGSADPDTEVEKCCPAPDYAGIGVIKYSFEVQCSCPGDAASA